MVPRIYSQNYAVRLSAKLLFLSKLRHLKKLTALVAFVSIFSFQGYSQCPLPISVECESDAVPMAIAAVAAGGTGCLGVTTGSYITPPTLPVCSSAPQSVTVRVIHDGTCDGSGFCDVVVNITGDATGPTYVEAAGSLDINEQCAADVTLVVPTATDNCGGIPVIVVFSDNTVPGACANDFVRTVIYRATDDCGNTDDFTVTITVDDNTIPVFVEAAGSLDINEQCAADVTLVAPTATDNCGGIPVIVVFSDNTVPGACANDFVRTVIYRATDDCGNTSDFTVTITVDDNTIPVFVEAAGSLDINEQCATDVTLVAPTATDNCGAVPVIVVFSDNTVPGACANDFVRTVVYRATDDCGNTDDFTVTITVDDNTIPVFVEAAGSLDINEQCAADVTLVAPTATDNCGAVPAIAIFSDITVPGACVNNFVRTVIYRATDDCGNTDDFTVSIAVDDNTVPVIAPAPADITVECLTDLVAAGDLAWTDNCDAGGNVTGVDGLLIGGECGGTITRTWNVMDVCGNSAATQSQTITIDDTTDPVIAPAPADITIECLTDLVAAGNLAWTDNCDVGGNVTGVDGLLIGGECGGTITRTWNISDICGNPATTQSQIITIHDTTNPAGSAPASITIPAAISVCRVDALAYVTVNYPFVPATVALGYNDNCSTINAASISLTSTVDSGDDCNWDVIYTYNVIDDCGNTLGSETWTISGSDTDDPTWTTAANALNTTVQCSDVAGIAAAQLLFPVASDICDMDVTNIVKTSGAFVANAAPCDESGSYTNTWTVTDACGNTSAIFTQVITIQDTQTPTWTTVAMNLDRTVECSDAAALATAQALFPVAIDNCDADVTNIVKTSGAFVASALCPQAGTYTNTWAVTDDCGNVSVDFTQVITIQDTQTPTWTTISGTLDAIVECSDAAGLAAAQALFPVATDNCDADVTNIVKTSGAFVANPAPCDESGSYTNTWTVTDDCGNISAIFTQVITIEDTTTPTWSTLIGALNTTVDCDDVAALAAANLLIPVAADNCDMDVTNIVKLPGALVPSACPQAGTITNTWTVTDDCGNVSATFAQVITVQDTQAPTWTTTANALNTTLECSDNAALATAQALFPIATDNCDADVTNIVKISGAFVANAAPCDESGSYTNTWTVTDDCGNISAIFTQVITVEDTTAPTWSTTSNALNTTLECSDAVGIAAAQAMAPVATDNCDSDVTNINKASGVFVASSACAQAGTYTNTWTVTDDCGNASVVFTQEITIQDTTNPTASNPAPMMVQCYPAPNVSVVTGEADNCTVAPTVAFVGDVSDGNTCPEVITRTYSVTDDCGNTINVIQIITIDDTIAPTGSEPAATSGHNSCMTDAITTVQVTHPFDLALLAAGYTDNCTTLTAAHIDSVGITVSGSDCDWDVFYTYNVMDDCGNIIGSETWVHSGEDLTAPTGTAPTGTTGINACAANALTAVPAFDATAAAAGYSDNCNNVTATLASTTPSGTDCNWMVTYTFNVADDCGNTLSNQTITHSGSDQTVPTFTTGTTALNSTLECNNTAGLTSAQALIPSANDNCGGAVSVTKTTTGAFVAGSCPNSGTYTNIFTATDACGNDAFFTQIITITDNTSPTWISAVGALNVALDCSDAAGLTAAQAAQPMPNDNCSANPDILIIKTAGTFNAGSCQNIGTYTNTFIALDECTNSSIVYTQMITITDNNVPTWTDTAGDLDVTLVCSDTDGLIDAQALQPTAIDNCSSSAGITITKTAGSFAAGSCPNAGTYTNTFIATDECGNMSGTFTQTITLTDNVAPTGTPPTGMTAVNDCLANAPAFNATTAAAGYTDDCGNVTATLTGTTSTGNDCNWTVIYTFSVADDCGNSLTETITHSGGDLTAPVIPAIADYSVNNAAGTCFQTVNLAVPGVTDNCGTVNFISTTATDRKGNNIPVITPTTAPIAILPVGTNDITMNFSDACGNTNSITYTVNVLDDEEPNVFYPSGVTLDFANCMNPVVIPNYGFLTTINDNCSGYNLTQTPAPGTLVSDVTTLSSGQTFMVKLVITDNFPSATNLGDSMTFIVTLNEDNTPVPNTPGAILSPVSGDCGPLVVNAPYAVDACGNTICGVPFPLPAGTIDLGPTCGTSGLCVTSTFDIAVSGATIPDNSPAGMDYTFNVPTNGLVDDVIIELDATHTWVGDLIVTLTAPDGTSAVIFDRPGSPASFFGCDGANLTDVIFSDAATNSSNVFENTCGNDPAITGSFQPVDPFTIFTDVPSDGTWTLNVSDNGPGDFGTLDIWKMTLCIKETNSTVTPDYLFPVGTHNITWTYDGGAGNIVTQLQTITVEDDNIAPTLNCVSDITLELDENGEVGTSASSLSGQNIVMVSGDNGVAGNSDFCVTSNNSQTIYFSWVYTTFDGPSFDPFGYTLNGNFVELTDPSGANNQSGSESLELTNLDVFCFRANTDDGLFGAATTTNVNFYPGFNGDFAQGNWALVEDPGVNGSASFSSVDATDNCGVDESTILVNGQNNVLFDCDDIAGSPIAVSVSVQDINGNTGFCTTNVTIIDNIDPTLSGIPNDTIVNCNAIPTAPTGVTASDNCNTIPIVFNETTTQLPDSSLCGFYNYDLTRTWSVSDQSGNTVTETQVITVQDIEAPIFAISNFPSIITINANAGSCDANVSLEITEADVLDLPGCVSFNYLTITNDGNGTGDTDASGTYPVGSTPVIFTVTDPCGNESSYTVNVNVVDNSPPFAACHNIIVGIPNGQDSIIIDASLIALIDNGSFDNCSPILEFNVFPDVFYCSQIATGVQEFPITLAVSVPGSTDTTFCETTITIQDNNDPVVTCIDPLIITLDANGTATATTAMLNGGIDDCSDIMTIELVGNTAFDVNDIGTHPISDGITPTLQVTDIYGNVGTCTPTTLVITPPITCLTSVDVIANGEVEIPYTSTSFVNVIGFQFSMQVDDETVATFAQDNAANLCGAITINVPNLSGIHQDLICNGNFTNQISTDGKVLSVSWFNTSLNPVSIPDGEALFNFRLNALGVVGDMTTFSITGAPFASELTTKYGNDILTDNPPLCVNPIGDFEVGDDATLPISGNVSTWSRTRIDTIGYDTISMMPLVTNPILDTVVLVAGQGLANASLVKIETLLPTSLNIPDTTDTDMTDANGDYSVQVTNVIGGVALDLTPRKNNPNWLNNGDVNSSDLFFIQQHIVNNIPFTSIYDYVAADVNQSGTITTLDLVLIQDVIVNPELAPIPSSVIDAYNPWRFIQKEYAETNIDPFDLDLLILLPAQPMAPVIPANAQNRFYSPAMLPMTDVDWIAVKVGQIFGGLNTSTLTTIDVDSRTGENFVMSVENQKVSNGELISIPVYAKDYAAFIAWQFTLEFDENYLEYHGMLPGAISGFGENKLGLNSVEEGIIGAVWYGTPNAVNSDEVLFTLQFTALDNADALSGLIDVTSRTVKSQSSLMSGATGEVSLAFFSPTVTTATDFELHQNRPNPFNGETLISFNLPEAGFAKVIISDISGRTLKVIEGDFAKGYNEVRIQSNELSSTGVLYYQLESAEHIATKKMIILE